MDKLKKLSLISLCFIFLFNVFTTKVYAASYGGYDRGYSDWSDIQTGNPGEVQRTVWRYSDAIFYDSCTHSTAYPALYETCKYDPYNCPREYCTGSIVHQDPYYVRCGSSCCCGRNYDWVLTTGPKCSDGLSSNICWACNECDKCNGSTGTAYDGSCGNTANGYRAFKTWGAWSAWSTTQYYSSNKRRVEYKYQYSFPYPPVLALKTAYYFVASPLSINDLMLNAVATDIVDGVITPQVQFVKLVYENGTTITNRNEIVDTSREQTITLTCKVKNSRNLTTTATKEYHIYDLITPGLTDPNSVNPSAYTNVDIYDRFISTDYIDTVNDNSLWDTDEAYKQALRNALDSTSGPHYELD